jgi:deoxyadenosine/deoxycytidine kinase
MGSDKPKMDDFNYDNTVIDEVVGGHINDSEIHITQEERENWSTFIKASVYYGNGSLERTIELDCDFDVSLVIIFARNRPMSVTRFSDSKNYNYTAFVGRYVNSMGAKFNSDFKSIVVNQSASAVMNDEYANLNESGVAYTYIMFR